MMNDAQANDELLDRVIKLTLAMNELALKVAELERKVADLKTCASKSGT
jgi:hypothetical protein